jgi:hypothetical protein
MKKVSKLILLALLFGQYHNTAFADDPYDALVKNSRLVEKHLVNRDCLVIGQIDFDEFIKNLESVRDAWLNRDYSIDFYRQRRKQVFVFSVVKRYAELITLGFYQKPKSSYNECKFEINIIANNSYGNKISFRAVSWKFNLDQASQINWKQVDPRDFQQIAIDYQIDPKINIWIADEPKFEP